MTNQSSSRRQVLAGVAGGVVLGLAGCASNGDGGDGTGNETTGTTSEDTETTTEETETTTETGAANVRVAHMSPNAPNVDVYVDGSAVLEDVPFKTVSDYLELAAGTHTVEITAADDAETSVFDSELDLAAETDYTLTAAGELGDAGDQPFEVLALEDDNSDPGGNDARLRAVHVSPDAPTVDITVNATGDAIFDGVPYGGSGYTEVEANDYTVEIRPDTESNDGEVVADYDVSLNGGTVYTAFAAGYLTPDDEPADESFELVVVQDAAAN